MSVFLWISDEWFMRQSLVNGAVLTASSCSCMKKGLEEIPLVFCFFVGSIVSVGDPKKKYTNFEKIGQGLVCASSLS